MHRIMLVGPDPAVLQGYEAALSRAGQTVTSAEGAQHAAAVARRFMPSVLVLIADLTSAAGRETLAGVMMHPSTAALPVLCLTAKAPVDVVVAAFRAGVCEVIFLPTQLETFLQKMLQVVGPTPGHPMARLAMDGSGPALLKRVGNFIRSNGCSAHLVINGAPAPAQMVFVDGNILSAQYGPTTGSNAIQRLLTEATNLPWQITLAPATPQPSSPAPTPPDTSDAETTFEIDLAQEAPPIELDTPSAAHSLGEATPQLGASDDFSLEEDEGESIELDFSDADQASETEALFAPAPSEAHTPPPSLPEASPQALEALPPVRILLVDDDASLLTLYSKFFKRAGWTVHTAPDGAQGYEQAIAIRPDAIVSDIMMPDVDGWGFLTRVRNDARLLDTKFLLLSCHGEYLNRLKTLNAGADDYLEKGIRGDAVVQRVRDAIAPQRQFLAVVRPGMQFGGSLAPLGIRFTLLASAGLQLTGVLTVQDRWATYRVQLDAGLLVAAEAHAAANLTLGREAMRALLGVGEANYAFVPALSLPSTMQAQMHVEVDAIAQELNTIRERAEEQMFAESSAVEVVNPQLAELYLVTCADAVRPIAASLLEGTAPREVLAASEASPLVVEWTVKDLLRKGIARFIHS